MVITTKIILICGLVLAVGWLGLFLAYSNKFKDEIAALYDDSFAWLYVVGFGFMKLFGYRIDETKNVKLIKSLGKLYSTKYALFYFYATRAKEISLVLTITPIILILAGISGSDALAFLALVLDVFVIAIIESDITDAEKERENMLMCEFPSVVSKLTLLTGAGLSVRDAFGQVAYSKDGVLYKEMQQTVSDISNNMSEKDAYVSFGNRCNIKEIKKFASAIVQNLEKGNADQIEFMRDITKEMWQVKKNKVKTNIDTAKSKMMLPTFLVFIGILIMVIAPMFSSISQTF